ncbi:MAG: putative glycoside hydrolase [Endomicrobium sp.]|nr:putative glycoside hydrolase [Endomicrobium sp.]
MKIHKFNFLPSSLLSVIFLLSFYANSISTVVLESQYDKKNLAITSDSAKSEKAKYIRGIHLSAWISGSEKHRKLVLELFATTELNTAVIDIKEYEGQVYIKVKEAEVNKTYVVAIPDLEKYILLLKEKGIYTIARIVIFRDNTISRKKPSLAVKNPDGTIWTDRKGAAWLDPYNKDAWDYNLKIAERAAEIGFDEIQFDYIRFPSDGNTKNCRYSKPHSATEASKALIGFLKEAKRRLNLKGAKISIDVFGLTTTATDDMGIGQKIVEMTEQVDYVSPMVYPSHYAKWTYGIADPNKEPYKVVYNSIEGALKRIPEEKLRPWLQDFSLGYKYGKNEVRAQMQACYDNKIGSWLLWNPRCIYTIGALKNRYEENTFQISNPPTSEMLKTTGKQQQISQNK